ncbi:PRC-barrel domain-containing protein [Streptomyces sp. CRN 30]|uniref:PRC-barrel domain-containing protein n=1 Tax=Streptomyces sp. CRN 30 TaxID=3075613 RepID=UPI002A8309BA|nr:PRC-barrel domain-containing protein [Streptomyces sp. CRN 30]
MNELMAARSLSTRPVVTLGGDAVAQVKDTVFDAEAGRITGFTLNGRGLLSGPLRQSLPWTAVHALGHDAVMIRDRRELAETTAAEARRAAVRGRVVGARLLTETGTEVGTVLDVVVEGGGSGRVVGFRVAASREFAAGPKRRRRRVWVPRGETVAVSGRALVLPAATVRYAAESLDGPDGLAALARRVPARRKDPLP